MSFKATFIGAGSIGFTRGLVRDLLSVPEFRDIELVFMDINEANLDMVTRLVQRDIDANGIPVRIAATTDRREALRGTRYVFNVVRIGGLEAFAMDVNIPLAFSTASGVSLLCWTCAGISARSPSPTVCCSTTPTPTP
jgi:alpha-galactosidase